MFPLNSIELPETHVIVGTIVIVQIGNNDKQTSKQAIRS